MKSVQLVFVSLFFLFFSTFCQAQAFGGRPDISRNTMTGKFKPGSHVKLFLQHLPYLAFSNALTPGLVRASDSEKGWEYDLAVSHKKISDTIYEFELRHGVLFQDGTPFNADAVVRNLSFFKKQPYLFTSIGRIFDRAEKLSEYKVRLHLTQKYGMLMHDLIFMQFYTNKYLDKFGWNGKPTGPNLAEAGPYGAGPYILTKGYIEGDRRSSVVELTANKNYWDPNYPKVEKITVYLDVDPKEAFNSLINTEGEVDIMHIPFSRELETMGSPYGKLFRSYSTYGNFIWINVLNGNPILREREVREALNKAIDQESLLRLSMMGEGELTPVSTSPNFFGVKKSTAGILPYSLLESPYDPEVRSRLIRTIKKYQAQYGLDPDQNLKLNIVSHKGLLFLLNDIKYFLSQINVDLDAEIFPTEEEIIPRFIKVRAGKSAKRADLIFVGNYDWFRHPWTHLFVYQPSNAWSLIGEDKKLDAYMEVLFKTPVDGEGYIPTLKSIFEYVYHQSYMLVLPAPKKIMALNKEVYFKPSPSSFIPIWQIEVSDNHWSVRSGDYPEKLKAPVQITNFDKEN